MWKGTPSVSESCACRHGRGDLGGAVPRWISPSFPCSGPAHLPALLGSNSLFIQNSADGVLGASHTRVIMPLFSLGFPPRTSGPLGFCPRRTQSLWICPFSRTLALGSLSGPASPPSGRENSSLKTMQLSFQGEPEAESWLRTSEPTPAEQLGADSGAGGRAREWLTLSVHGGPLVGYGKCIQGCRLCRPGEHLCCDGGPVLRAGTPWG